MVFVGMHVLKLPTHAKNDFEKMFQKQERCVMNVLKTTLTCTLFPSRKELSVRGLAPQQQQEQQ